MLTDRKIENLKIFLLCNGLTNYCPFNEKCEICDRAFKRFQDYLPGDCPCDQVGKKKVIRKAKQVIKAWEDQQKYIKGAQNVG